MLIYNMKSSLLGLYNLFILGNPHEHSLSYIHSQTISYLGNALSNAIKVSMST